MRSSERFYEDDETSPPEIRDRKDPPHPTAVLQPFEADQASVDAGSTNKSIPSAIRSSERFYEDDRTSASAEIRDRKQTPSPELQPSFESKSPPRPITSEEESRTENSQHEVKEHDEGIQEVSDAEIGSGDCAVSSVCCGSIGMTDNDDVGTGDPVSDAVLSVGDESYRLAHAQLIDYPVLVAAVDDDDRELDEVKTLLRRQLWIGLGIGLVLVVAAVALLVAFLAERGSDPASSPTSNPARPISPTSLTSSPSTTSTRVPTSRPSSASPVEFAAPALNPAPTTTPTTDVIEATYVRLIQSRMPTTTFEDSTPQRQALDWILQDSYSTTLNDDRIVQRFALAVLYYSTNGRTTWSLDSGEWVQSSTECDWGEPLDLQCTEDEIVNWMFLERDGLTGSIPPEIGLLTSLTWLDLGVNSFEGTIPTEIGLVTSLTVLKLGANDLEGGIPTEIGFLSALEELRLFNTNLEGTIPTQIGLLTALTWLDLSNNGSLSGSVPTEVVNLAVLNDLFLHSTNLMGSIPSSLCSTLDDARIDCGEIECDCCKSNDWDGTQYPPC